MTPGGILSSTRWTFGDFELDAARFQLLCRSQPVKLERIPLELLIFMVERQGQLVSRDEIATRLWGNRVHVDVDSGVNTAIRKLRAALNDSPETPVFIERVPGKGYRFIGHFSERDHPAEATVRPERPARRWIVAAVALGLATAAAVVYYARFRSAGPTGPATSVTIAVLPFQNLSSDPEQEYFSDGLTEETIAALGRVATPRIRVIARTSSMAYRGTRKTAGEIGDELGANYLVESTVRRDARHVRIMAKLIRVEDQVQVWNNTYELEPSGLLRVQQEIGTAIARQVGGEFSPRAELAERPSTQDADAHDLYLRSRYYWYQRTPDSMRKSLEYVEAALRKDPTYALAHAALADTYVIQALVSWADPRDLWEKARMESEKALGLDPNLAEAHTAKGIANFFMAWDWPTAERSFRRAIELNPNYAIAHQFYGHLLSNSRRHEEAIAEIQKARNIDPLSPMMHTFAGGILVMARRYGAALPILQQSLAIDPDFFPTHSVLGLFYQQTGKPDVAVEEYRKAYRLSGGNIVQLAYQGFVLGQIGRRAEAEHILTAMNQIAHSRFVPPFAFALVYTGLGDRDAAFHWLDRAYAVRDVGLVFLPAAPQWDTLRSDKRFQDLLRRCRFPV
jgi:TolB-like protein/DNA-binding winged helix-turn-helix (wHTH) protein/Tfp pilus assembly protein PilF